jgi:hypothetical protein
MTAITIKQAEAVAFQVMRTLEGTKAAADAMFHAGVVMMYGELIKALNGPALPAVAEMWRPHWDKGRAARRQRAFLVRNEETGQYHRAKNGRPQVYEFEHSAIAVARRLNMEA